MEKQTIAARQTIRMFFFFIFLLLIGGGSVACSRKSGCPANENVHVKPNRKGELPTKGGSSGLFPKKMQKKM